MLHILFLILKIICIILLVILGIALTLVSVVLFVPIRYRLKAETTDGMKGVRAEVKATWLFRLVSAFAIYQEEELDWQVRIGWKKIKANEVDGNVMSEKVDEKKSSSMDQDSGKEEDSSKQKESREETPQEKKSQKEETTKENWIEKIKCTIKEICDKIKKAKDILLEETHIQAILRIKNEVVLFVKRIKPDKVKGYVRFGLEDPYNTGRVLAVLSVLYPFYGENIQIYPEFEREILEGDVFIKGRVHLIHLLIAICNLYFDKNIKTAYKNLKSLKE